MTDPTKTVFISYRRSTSKHLARSIFMDLRSNGWDAFFDVNTIDSGEFDRIILNQIAARAHFVLVLSPDALKRCVNEDDWLKREIEEAMRLKRNIVPVFEEGFSFEVEKQFLPNSIQDLPRFNALRIPHDFFDEAMEKLRNRFLKQPFYGEVVPTPDREAAVVEQRVSEAVQASVPAKMESARDYFQRGYARQDKGDLDGALADYNEAIRLDPNDALSYNNRGVIRKDKGDLDSALADYNEAIRLDPNNTLPYNNRGNTRKDKGDLDGALADYSEAIRLDPNNALFYFNRGIIRRDKGDLDGALADYNEAIRLNPQYAYAYNHRGWVRNEQGDLDGAIADFSEAVRLNPNYTESYCNRGLAHGNKHSWPEAIADFEAALRIDPHHETSNALMRVFSNLKVIAAQNNVSLVELYAYAWEEAKKILASETK
jgi:tetratricopeptide (TPR) repeat protein